MFKNFQYVALTFAALCAVFLPGCGTQKSVADTPSDNRAAKPGPNFSLDTPVEHIAADPRGKVILDHDVPGLMASQSYLLVEDMSLSQIATVSGGRLTQAKLNTVQADLTRLSATGKSGY